MFQALRKHEIVGICVKESYFEHISIDDNATMTQVIDINTQMSSEDEDGIFSFINDDTDPTIKKTKFLCTTQT